MRLSILVSRFPYPLEKGDKLRMYHQIRILSQYYQIQLIALSNTEIKEEWLQNVSQFCTEVHVLKLSKVKQLIRLFPALLFSRVPLQCAYFHSYAVEREVKRLIKLFNASTVYAQLARTAEYLKNVPQKKVLDFQDIFSKGMYRTYQQASLVTKPVYYLEYKRMLKYEAKMLDRFDAHCIISEQDRDLIPHKDKDQVLIVRNGVNFDFFEPQTKREPSYDLVFVGNMNYPPNIDAAKFLCTEILPKIHKTHPDCKVLLAGATPHRKVRALESEHVKVSGWLDDIREAYADAKIFIAPMRIGTGLQNKLLEAMSMEMPVITTPLANNALGANSKELLIGKTAKELAAHAVYLLNHRAEAKKLSKAGKSFVLDHYSWEAVSQPLVTLLRA